ncbi:hypothetical protein POM88_024535 [Heracleum sosnowskyi]|uniref:Uncharacterized protein n=1 Tax=Heracleum sosnowskyi TaxID=360622 RepID=A0AAD8MLJ1_9APIA|nr:hypothetical protein POM88_024535 [Heracleum sosnowskyi]
MSSHHLFVNIFEWLEDAGDCRGRKNLSPKLLSIFCPQERLLPQPPSILICFTSGRKSSSGSPQFVEAIEQSGKLDAYSPDQLAGELFLDNTLAFTAEWLSRAP